MEAFREWFAEYWAQPEYRWPAVGAVVFHGVVMVLLFAQWDGFYDKPLVVTPQAIRAALVTEMPEKPKPAKTKPKPKPKPKPKKSTPPKPKPKPKPKPSAKPTPKPAPAKPEVVEPAPPQPLDLDLDDQQEIAADLEAVEAQLAQAELNAVRHSEATKHSLLIRRTIEAVWRKPSQYSLGTKVALRIKLLPDGTVDSVKVIRSSGNDAFDRSAVTAVRKVRQLPVPRSLDLFSEYFRSFVLVFSPDGGMNFESGE